MPQDGINDSNKATSLRDNIYFSWNKTNCHLYALGFLKLAKIPGEMLHLNIKIAEVPSCLFLH